MARYAIDPDRSQVWIEGSSSVHPVHANADGLTGWVQVSTRSGALSTDPKLAGEVRIAVDRLRSGNPLVDRETRRRIDAAHHPEIVGTVTSATRPEPGHLTVSGTIAFRGEVQPVEGDLTVVVDGDTIEIEGSQSFDVRAWGLQPPRVGLLKVHPDVAVRIHLTATRDRPAPKA